MTESTKRKVASDSKTKSLSIKKQLLLNPGQGTIDEQIEKLMREEQRTPLYAMIATINDEEVKGHVLVCREKSPNGFSEPSLMRFSVPRWKGFHEVYWESLCGRLKLAIGGVVKLEYDAKRGTVIVRHFDTHGHQKKPASFVTKLIAKICILVETGKLSTDFTRWRHKAEHASKLGELSPAQVSVFAVILKKLKFF